MEKPAASTKPDASTENTELQQDITTEMVIEEFKHYNPHALVLVLTKKMLILERTITKQEKINKFLLDFYYAHHPDEIIDESLFTL